MENVVSVRQVCELLDVVPVTVYKWRQEGAPVLIKKPLRFDLDKLMFWLKYEREEILKERGSH